MPGVWSGHRIKPGMIDRPKHHRGLPFAGRLELPGMLPVATWQGFREDHQPPARVHRLSLTSHRYRIRPGLAIDARPQVTREGFRITHNCPLA